MREGDSERERKSERESVCVCVRERERVCVYVCGLERDTDKQGDPQLNIFMCSPSRIITEAHDAFLKYLEAIEEVAGKAQAGTTPAKDIGACMWQCMH